MCDPQNSVPDVLQEGPGGAFPSRETAVGVGSQPITERPIFQNKHWDTWSHKGFFSPAEYKGHNKV